MEDEIREADLVNELIELTIARIDNFPEDRGRTKGQDTGKPF